MYLWVDGAARVKQLLLHLDAMQAQILDQALMQADDQYQPVLTKFVQQGQPIPEDVLTALSTLCALEFVEGETFLPVQALMQSYDDFCFSAAEFLPKAMYRILSISFPERFNLQDLIDHQDDIRLLYRHAEEAWSFTGVCAFNAPRSVAAFRCFGETAFFKILPFNLAKKSRQTAII